MSENKQNPSSNTSLPAIESGATPERSKLFATIEKQDSTEAIPVSSISLPAILPK